MNEQLRRASPENNELFNKWSDLANQADNPPRELTEVGEKGTGIGEHLNKCLDLRKLVDFFDTNADILHKSRYHQEGFKTHCLLVVGAMLEEYEAGNVSEEAVVAACLHDIAKPRTAALNKRNEACFYGHENVTSEEFTEFLDPNYPGFGNAVDLVHGHMLPLGIGENTPEPFRGRNQEQLNSLLARHDKQFERDLMILSDCDSHASVKSDDDLARAEEQASLTKDKLLQFTK